MPAACCLFRSNLAYRRDAFCAGLESAGFDIELRPRSRPQPGDALLIWNRRGGEHILAKKYEAAGGVVIVAENGYIWPSRDQKLYALAIGHHNGAGRWREGGPERWDSFGIEVQPWREGGDEVVMLPQRGIGEAGVAMHRDWLRHAINGVKTDRRVRIRHHPGDKAEPYEALANAHCAVTWGSGAAIKALVSGVPVFHTFPKWIGAPASTFGFGPIESPKREDRLPMLRRLAWAQWRLSEVESGEAFRWLLT